MAFTADQLQAHPDLYAGIRRQSQALILMQGENPRRAAVFATQQRWLLAHTGFALYFSGGLLASRFLDANRQHAIASHNTAETFLKEMIQYQFLRPVAGFTGKRMRPLEPTEIAVMGLHGWLNVHLSTLDGLDGGARAATHAEIPALLAKIHPKIAFTLLSTPVVREPATTFSLFTWLNNGGIVMDYLIAGITETDPLANRVPTDVRSITDLAARLTISRTHLTRKLRAAELLGSIGWMGKRGSSTMWVSKEFRQEYAAAQAVKLAIIDAAYQAAIAEPDAASGGRDGADLTAAKDL